MPHLHVTSEIGTGIFKCSSNSSSSGGCGGRSRHWGRQRCSRRNDSSSCRTTTTTIFIERLSGFHGFWPFAAFSTGMAQCSQGPLPNLTLCFEINVLGSKALKLNFGWSWTFLGFGRNFRRCSIPMQNSWLGIIQRQHQDGFQAYPQSTHPGLLIVRADTRNPAWP